MTDKHVTKHSPEHQQDSPCASDVYSDNSDVELSLPHPTPPEICIYLLFIYYLVYYYVCMYYLVYDVCVYGVYVCVNLCVCVSAGMHTS